MMKKPVKPLFYSFWYFGPLVLTIGLTVLVARLDLPSPWSGLVAVLPLVLWKLFSILRVALTEFFDDLKRFEQYRVDNERYQHFIYQQNCQSDQKNRLSVNENIVRHKALQARQNCEKPWWKVR